MVNETADGQRELDRMTHTYYFNQTRRSDRMTDDETG